MFRILSAICILAAFFTSCTSVVSTNFPGRAENAIPSNWQGRYVMTLPAALGSLEKYDKNKEVVKQYITIQKDKIVWDHSSEINTFLLNDSLTISTVDGEKYISLKNRDGYYIVFLVKEIGDNLNLFGIYSENKVEKPELESYFRNATLINNREDAELLPVYAVTLIDQKLKDYFKSATGKKDPVKLVRQ